MDYEALGEGRAEAPGAAVRAEQARRAGDPVAAAAIAHEGLGHTDDAAVRVALALALLDQGELDEARHALESLLEVLAGDEALHHGAGFGSYAANAGMISDGTLAAATAATLELVGSLDDDGFERAMQEAEVQRELMLDADEVAEQALREVPAELPDEILPSADSPFATRTFADLLERQGHEFEAETLRSSLAGRPQDSAQRADGPQGAAEQASVRVQATLEQWLENLRRTAA